ncbi:hypothetical protein [Streptomyces sp. NPDC059828]|uniref:hypothetical protein n=1 Tax=Streptomyces sp. NPDC059828 TaxID=3346965 RepID=UPI0036473F7A
MSDTPPSHPVFDGAPGLSDGGTTDARDWYGLPRDEVEGEQLQTLQKRLKRRMAANDTVFLPHLLIRSRAGDRGVRPFTGVFWESPDILLSRGEPDENPDIPTTLVRNPLVGRPHTLYAHVWNLGLAPMTGVTVEFLVFDPSIAFDRQTALFRAVARTDLAGRTTPGEAHRLVKCPVAWTPSTRNNGHECVIVRVSGVGDTLQPDHRFEPAYDRHVGQRNIQACLFGDNQRALVERLRASLPRGAQLRFRVAGKEAQTTLDLLAPGLTVDPRVEGRIVQNIEDAPKPVPGHATVVCVEGVTANGVVVGGYTLLMTAQPLG